MTPSVTDPRLLAFLRLLDIMDTLRAECPWDKKQTMETLRPLTIEETYELADAILDHNMEGIKEELGDLTNLEFRLEKNGVVVQRGNTADMLFSFDKLISYVSGYVSFRIGDLLFTGTPAGVGSVVIGDRLTAYLGDRLMLDFLIR